jgi:hypothetical protein
MQVTEVDQSARLSRSAKLAEAMLRDRTRRKGASASRSRRTIDRLRPLLDRPGGPWRVVAPADRDPGYLPTTPMRMGRVGCFIACRSCGIKFESKGWGYCPTCMEMPAEERCAREQNKADLAEIGIKPPTRRMCEAGCGQHIPRWRNGRLVSSATRFCSDKCAARARRRAKGGFRKGAGYRVARWPFCRPEG